MSECTVTIHGMTYQVGKWLPYHPGGDILATYHGRDASAVFDAFHGKEGQAVLAKMRGVPSSAPPMNAAAQIREEALATLITDLHRRGLFRTNTLWYAYKTTTTFAFCVLAVTLLWLLGNHPSPLVSWTATTVAAVSLGVFYQQSGWLCHELCHNQVFRSRGMLSKAACYLTGNVWQGTSVLWWKDRHNKHHANSNTLEQDPDIDNMPVFLWDEADHVTFARRFKGSVPWWAAYQHLYFLPFLSLLQIIWNIQSIRFVLQLPRNPSKVLRGAHSYELATLLLHHAWTVYVAFAMTPSVFAGVSFVAVSRLVGGFCIGVVVFYSHYSCEHFRAEDDRDWARTQIGSTRNCHPSWWMDWFSGGINYQIEHHLFPTMPRHNLAKARPYVQRYCRKMGIEYQEMGFIEGLSHLLRHMRAIGLSVSSTASASARRRNTSARPQTINDQV